MTLSTAPIAIGIDVGGTLTRVAAIHPNGLVQSRCQRPTAKLSDADRLVGWLADAASTVKRETAVIPDAVLPVGVAVPGTLDHKRHTVVRSMNLPFLDGLPLTEILAKRFGQEPALLTDADAATWGEYHARRPRSDRFVHVRLGTGVACGAVIDGRLQRLDADRRDHLDLLIADTGRSAPPCPCGRHGCLETIASGPAIEQAACALIGTTDMKAIQEVWEQGNRQVTQLLEQVADAVAIVFARLASHFGARVLCLGGGVAERLPCLLELITIRLRPRNAQQPGQAPTLESALLGDDAGVVGAGLWGMHVAIRPSPPAEPDPR